MKFDKYISHQSELTSLMRQLKATPPERQVIDQHLREKWLINTWEKSDVRKVARQSPMSDSSQTQCTSGTSTADLTFKPTAQW